MQCGCVSGAVSKGTDRRPPSLHYVQRCGSDYRCGVNVSKTYSLHFKENLCSVFIVHVDITMMIKIRLISQPYCIKEEILLLYSFCKFQIDSDS